MHTVTTRIEHDLPGNQVVPVAACYGGHRVASIVRERKLMRSAQWAEVLTKPQMIPTQVA